jgi:hypothetical protein
MLTNTTTRNTAAFSFEKIINRKGFYIISNQTLSKIRDGCYEDHQPPQQKELEQYLERENLILTKIDDATSLIKKV